MNKQLSSIEMFENAEQRGMKLAIKGRLVAVGLIGILLAISRGADRAPDFLLAAMVFAALGVIHYRLIGSRFDHPLSKYLFLTIDVVLLSVAVAVMPPTPVVDVPQIFMFRFNIFPYYYLLLGLAAFSFSPGLVVWAGISGSIGWLAAFVYVLSNMDNPLTWFDMPIRPTLGEFYGIFLSPDFAAPVTRAQEAIVFLVVAVLISIVMARARLTVKRQFEAEREKNNISAIFGEFVPPSVADSIIRNDGIIRPLEREATVLFCDLAGFTDLTESKGAQVVVDTLNEFFDLSSQIIANHNGVITQFQGDGILATFNVPSEDEHHASRAVQAARELSQQVQERRFNDIKLSLRVGISTGMVIAGNVGGGGRQTYTVYGEPVNLAARLEALNKRYDTEILLSSNTATLVNNTNLTHVVLTDIKGLKAPIDVFTVSN